MDTTGIHCQEALYELIGKENVTFIDPDNFDNILDEPKPDLFLAIDDDGEWTFPQDWIGPKVVWYIDTHTSFEKRLIRAPSFDFVFTAQARGAYDLQSNGIVAHWIPLACNPSQHHPIEDIPQTFQWSFVGNAPRDRWLPTNRADLIDYLKDRWGDCFSGNAYFEHMMMIYCSSQVVFNRSIVDDLNMRVFEACASGTPSITDDVVGLDNLFEDGIHLYKYFGETIEDEINAVDELMESLIDSDPDILKIIGDTAQEHVYRYHTYKHRMQEILKIAIDYGSYDGLMRYERDHVKLCTAATHLVRPYEVDTAV